MLIRVIFAADETVKNHVFFEWMKEEEILFKCMYTLFFAGKFVKLD